MFTCNKSFISRLVCIKWFTKSCGLWKVSKESADCHANETRPSCKSSQTWKFLTQLLALFLHPYIVSKYILRKCCGGMGKKVQKHREKRWVNTNTNNDNSLGWVNLEAQRVSTHLHLSVSRYKVLFELSQHRELIGSPQIANCWVNNKHKEKRVGLIQRTGKNEVG